MKKIISFVLIVCTLMLMPIYAGAAVIGTTPTAGPAATADEYNPGFVPQHTPKVYSITDNNICDNIYFPGDTINFSGTDPKLVGFYLTYDSGNTDNTADAAVINNSYNAGTHKSITVKDKPFMLSYKGQGPVAGSSTLRCNHYCVTRYENIYLLDVVASTDEGVLAQSDNLKKFAIYPANDDYTINLEDYLSDPVCEGCWFANWKVVGDTFAWGGRNESTLGCQFSHSTYYTSEMYPNTRGTIIAHYDYGCTVTLDASGGTIDGKALKIYETDCTAGHDNDPNKDFDLSKHIPTKSGFVFGGWYADKELKEPVTDVAELGLNHVYESLRSATLYAKWGYSVTSLPCAGGSISADKSVATPDETVTLTVTPDTGYRLKQIVVLDGLGQDLVTETNLKITNNTFIIPNMNVRVQALFEKINPDGFAEALSETDGAVQFDTSVPDNCELDIREFQLPDTIVPGEGEQMWGYDITVMRNNSYYSITDNDMTVFLALPLELRGFDYYYVSFLGEDGRLCEAQRAKNSGDCIQFFTSHLSKYVVKAGNYLPTSYLIGDADGSFTINVKDATAIQKHIAQLSLLTGNGLSAANVNSDSAVNIKDATAIQKYSASILSGYPIGDLVK